jgi:hypothetical protein
MYITRCRVKYGKRISPRPKAPPEWLNTLNEAFDGLKPLGVIERGAIDRLWNMIFYFESGVAS